MTTGKSLPMLPWWPTDYIAATRHLSLTERGAYTDLLWFQWVTGPLPKEPDRLARLIGCGADEFATVWPAIKAKFAETDSGLVNLRLEGHRARAVEIRDGRSRGARRTNSQRWGKRSGPSLSESVSESVSDAPSESVSVSHLSPSLSPTHLHPLSTSPGVLEDSDSRPRRARTSERPAYERQEFHQQVIVAYHELLPDLPPVKVWSSKRRQALNTRIRERCKDGKPADTIGYWRALFEQVAASPFLCGRSTDFRADLEWLIRPENFAKVIEGRYTAGRSNGNGVVRAR